MDLRPVKSKVMFTAAVITVSDSCHLGTRVDLSGPTVAELLAGNGFEVLGRVTVPDERTAIERALESCASRVAFVVTTGGTGIGPRDVTPEATRNVCDRLIDGIPELMRSEGCRETPFAVLSRALCGTLDQSLVLNLPGSPRGATTSLKAVLPLISHALMLLAGGESPHPESDNRQDETL